MSELSFPERMFEVGFTDLISVVPPGAQLMPSSTIPQASIGKVPGRRHVSGLWAGYDWRKTEASMSDVRQWVFDGANVGLRATRFPAVDIDCTDESLAQMIEVAVLGKLGPAAVRIGKAPKRLLMYSLDVEAEPFSRMRLWIITHDGQKHLVEILGEGQQYLVYGTHPSTGLPYKWLDDPTTFDEAEITREKAASLLDDIQSLVNIANIGYCEREGDGKRSTRTAAADQDRLLAPSIDVLRECVAAIPNSDSMFPTRTDYLRIGYAIKASCGIEHDEDGFEIYADWAARWDGGANDIGIVRDDWRRMNGERSVGWNFLAQMARGYGYNDVAEDFEVTSDSPTDMDIPLPEDDAAPGDSDQELAELIIARHRGVLRFVPQKGQWLVWDGARWQIDAELAAEDIIVKGLKRIAIELLRREGTSAKEQNKAMQRAQIICSAGKATSVAQLVRINRAIAVPMDALDHDQWILNTPSGIIDLTTGKLSSPNPDALATKITAVPADFAGDAPQWIRFLTEATGQDAELAAYLQRLAGYALTGSTKEQHLSFLFGPGGNGKSLFLNVLTDILGDYAKVAEMNTFAASQNEKHTTDLASLMGARLVTASETAGGKRWDEQRVKAATGGERIAARFMRMDNFWYKPQFKLVFSGNHQPELRDIGDSMRRRIHMVPFTVKPAVTDLELGKKLEAEYPAILAWMVEGCLAWQKQGLAPPPLVTAATAEYFANEDAFGKWIGECIGDGGSSGETTGDLFSSWQEWANPRKEFVGSQKRLASALVARGWPRWQEPGSRRMGFGGVRILQQAGFESLT